MNNKSQFPFKEVLQQLLDATNGKFCIGERQRILKELYKLEQGEA